LSVTLIHPATKLETIAKRYWRYKPPASLKNRFIVLNPASRLETFPAVMNEILAA
jgi:hypothetical protein